MIPQPPPFASMVSSGVGATRSHQRRPTMRQSAAIAPALLLAATTLLAAACGGRMPAPRLEPTEVSAPAPIIIAAPPEPIRIPEGCEINLRGDYRLAGSSGARYRIDDDGERATIRPLDTATTEEGAGAGISEPPQELKLERTSNGFRGQVLGQALTHGGAMCPAAFAAQIIRCDPRSLTLRSEDAVKLDEDCTARPVEGASSDKVLTRE